MYHHEHTPIEWFQSRPFYYPPPMSRPVSKSFNRISDFIFPDTLHLTLPSQHQQPVNQHYQRINNHSLPVLNRRDLIIVERLPVEEFDNIDLLYREQQQYYQPNRQIRRRYSSIADERRISSNDKNSIGLANRSIAYRERIRDRRKRHTTDNVYHSMLKSMLEKDEQQKSSTNNKNSNYILSYQTTLDPITDSESIPSLHEEKNNEITHCRVPINGTIPITTERRKQRQHNSSISSRDSSSDTDIAGERRSIITNNTHYQQDSSIWERLPSSNNQSKRFIPINSSFADTNNHQTISRSNHLINSSPFDNVINYDSIDNQTLSQDSTHHVSLCVNDLHTTLFIDENTLNNNNNNIKTMNNGGKAIIKTFIDRIIKRLQHFKHSLDNGLIQIRKPTTDNQIIKTKINLDQSLNSIDDHRFVRPYFLIRPQTVLMLPNETAKFKCCFGGDPFPTLTWSHNESRIPEILATNSATSTRYQIHKLHDIYYLDIGPIKLSDNGQIKCILMNRFGREETIAQLFVVASPADGMPRIIQPLNNVTIVEGQPLKLSCNINGLQITVNWFHNGKLISPTTPLKSDYNDENAIFTLSRCLRTDVGTVDCLVKNRFGEVRTSCRIEVVNDPEFD